ncbi:cell wall-binding repeat-containing protein [Candidatus Poriferisodalis sp.]|uniref:cell wall-binding repeat-containing protein n=1 Tax=Candidatus Poriferisodalis sp. TaxID=3101277 RepID=UPI003B026141
MSGDSVFELAANVAGSSCNARTGSHSVAIASGENWPDALAGAALDRPLLLTQQDALPAVARRYLEPCASQDNAKAIILGGPAAVSEDVVEELRSLGYRVDRFAGEDRYATARRIAQTFAPQQIDTVYLASGANFADAVAAAPSVTRETPLVLTTPDKLHVQARRFLTDADRNVSSVTILGGTAAVSAAVEAEIRELGITVRRIAGADRYETAALIARRAISDADCHPVVDVAVASGTMPFGGLAAGAVRGPCEPLLLVPASSEAVPKALAEFGRDWLATIGSRADIATVTGIGSASVVAAAALAAVANSTATGTAPSTSQRTEQPAGSGSAEGEVPDWEAVARSVVRIRCVDGFVGTAGSGFVVGDGRRIVTNHHVVVSDSGFSCGRIHVYTGGTFERAPQRVQSAELVRVSQRHDLALLTLGPDADPLPTAILSDRPLRAGERLTALGYPEIGGDTMTLTAGRYSGTLERDGITRIKTDTPLAPGNSGGPVLNDRREVIGVSTTLHLALGGSEVVTVGTLGLLATSASVLALLSGDIG